MAATILFIVLGIIIGAVAALLYFLPHLKSLRRDGDRIQASLAEMEALHDKLNRDAQESSASLVRFRTENELLHRQIAERKEDEATLIAKFESLSNRIFDAKTEKFKQQSSESIATLLTPLREKMSEFQKKVDDSFGLQAMEQRSLKDQIRNIVEANSAITLQAESLASALKGDSKVRGNWGEYILEKLLEDSGLRKGMDYIVQGSGLDLVNDETDRKQRPDVVVNLPDGKHLIIDSKLPLTHYERYFSESDETLQAAHLKAFLHSVRERVQELEASRYQDNAKLGTPDFVLMFIPIEGAYALAVQQDHALHEHAWGKRVVIVCPTTLFATMRTVASLWRLERQNRNVQEIADQGGRLYDKIAGLVGTMEKLGRQMKTAENTFDDAMKKLNGKGSIASSAGKLKELGAKTSKTLQIDMEDEAGVVEEIFGERGGDEELDRQTGT